MNILEEFDTIAAPATPMGAGGVGIIRISGEKAFEIIGKIFTNTDFQPRKFNHGWIVDNTLNHPQCNPCELLPSEHPIRPSGTFPDQGREECAEVDLDVQNNLENTNLSTDRLSTCVAHRPQGARGECAEVAPDVQNNLENTNLSTDRLSTCVAHRPQGARGECAEVDLDAQNKLENTNLSTDRLSTCVALDEVIVLPFFAPNSYTGEDVVEIQCHGGVQVVKNILNLVLKNGARMAEKGEFTKRAFLNKRMDLSQAESVADIIHSKTSEFAKVSMKNLSGVLKEKINNIRNDIFEVLSKITAGIDFPEDVNEPKYSYLIECFSDIISQIDSVLSGANTSNIFRQGASVAIVGKPNVGKSSLFNALLNLERAIVTDIAGTTRDVLRETLDLGIPVTLVDTAGIREDEEVSKVEKIGIEYSKQSLDEADLVLFIYDASKGLDNDDKEVLELLKDKNHIVIANKSDLVTEHKGEALYVSALSGEGIKELKELLKSKVCDIEPENLEFVTNTRQQECLKKARNSMEQALLAAQINELQDLISIDVKSAIIALDELTGELVTDNILENIFEHFCIGK